MTGVRASRKNHGLQPQRLAAVNVIDQVIAISLLKPEEIFSLGQPYP
jgi:hypothetical protein